MRSTVPVSVVIPCFKCADTIARAVNSVAEQTCLPIEVILVDDCSDDGTWGTLQALSARYPLGWVQVVLLGVNQGSANARNEGWGRALGDFVAFLDADDAWHPQKIELQYEFMKSHPQVSVSGHGYSQVSNFPSAGGIVVSDFRQVSSLYVLLKNPFVTPSYMVRRDLPMRFPTGQRYMEDHFFLMQVALSGKVVMRANMPLAFIFKHIYGETGLSADLRRMHFSELSNYRVLWQTGRITDWMLKFMTVYLRLKYLRRLVVVRLRGWLSA